MSQLLFLLALLPLATGQCPPITDLPILYDDNTFLCAYEYQRPGDDDPIQGCSECEGLGVFVVPDTFEDSVEDSDFYYGVGSIISMAGCTYYGFNEPYYGGDVYEYPGPATYPNIVTDVVGGEVCGKTSYGFQSLRCECVQKMIECSPSDDFVNVLVCDALDSDVELACGYTESIGTTFTEEASNSLAVSEEVASTVQVSSKIHGMFTVFFKYTFFFIP